LLLDGSTKDEERVINRDKWNSENSEYSIFILSMRTGGLSLHLQTGDTVIIYDIDYNLFSDQQGLDQVDRIELKSRL
jgi:SNF2 family DNA or RNA helicase